jgi:hypothetical protein
MTLALKAPTPIAVLLIVLLYSPGAESAETPCPNPPVVSIDSSNVPNDVCVPDNFTGNPIQFFDDFSWKSFIAMVWPALSGQRGTPDPSRKVGDTSVALVFQTLKNDWEVFQPNPTDWEIYPTSNPCNDGQPPSFDDPLILASFSKFGNLGEAGFGDLVHALPAQNGTWVRYATAFNEIEYHQIFADQLYKLDSLKKASPITFSNNAIDIKSSWIDMTGIAHPERYYTRKARVMDPVSGQCSTKLVGLVGIHIVHKTSSRPQWIWSSFEQVDTAPASAAPAQTPPLAFGFNRGMPGSDPNAGFPPKDWAKPVVYNVVRVKPIHPSTQETNAQYQKALGGVWQFYQLVMTQWPVPPEAGKPIPPNQPGTPDHTFPGTHATTSFANVTLETWDQNSIFTGCMNCHNHATTGTPSTDFLWALQVNAISTPSLTASLRARQMPALVGLKQLLEQAAR